jgi:exonuclease VII large subunit
MATPGRGLYEVLITEALEEQLGQLDAGLEAIRARLQAAEAADRISLHLTLRACNCIY